MIFAVVLFPPVPRIERNFAGEKKKEAQAKALFSGVSPHAKISGQFFLSRGGLPSHGMRELVIAYHSILLPAGGFFSLQLGSFHNNNTCSYM